MSSASADREDWKNTILAGLANYIDAGSIVAGAVALALWKKEYGLDDSLLGLIAAFGPNAIAAGIGALIGGRLCDLLGRKKIYQYDMLFYAFGMLWLVFAMNAWMVIIGFFLVGLAVGADIPASWSLIAEMAPDKKRGKHSGVAQLLWYLGPVVVLVMALVLDKLGLLGVRIIFAHLAILAIALTFLRSKMQESQRWVEAQKSGETAQRGRWQDLFTRQHIGSMAFLAGTYLFWNLWAGTNGFFFPYILSTVGSQTQVVSVAVQTLSFLLGMASIFFIFMKLADRVNQRLLFGISAITQVIGMALLAIFPLTLPVAIIHVFLMSVGGGFGAQSFFQLWSSEMFPTALRATAQGVMFAIVRIVLGVFSFFVPALVATGFHTLAWILVGFLAISGVIGFVWAPRNEGKSLEQLDAERAA
ncbi:MFS transporter [Sphingomonas koreensis]|jgi:inositol transporter-like SP family MFS transporter|uniref:MFS transporter n=1 Tax=Sphingomonas koreensis TaxID=93064 RepID=A0A1L6J5W5_9SPHN|nr:MFS transporter [Sphingomonas koreensis]APR51295.1 MFS transporter [Sphingomonas koreensis]MDC7810372.1 MFS transporter [Sphingomonas koreensis]RSU17582.1 MFS transporter [Sphingomonas koreensis]RSU21838.1 MFS transporter [Sphingomonas koreensis]RSU26205.1 MFS transporter [Sphingomonas koreensis]